MTPATDVPAAVVPAPRRTALFILAGVAVGVCGLMLWPFLPGVAAGAATAAVVYPAHRHVRRWTGNRDGFAAGITTALTGTLVVVAVGLLTLQLAVEARQGVKIVREKATDGTARQTLENIPYLGGYAGELLRELEAGEISLEQEARAALNRIGRTSLGVAQGAAATAFQLLLAGFVLFYALKDHDRLLGAAERLMPVARPAADRIVGRMDDAVKATVYGTLLAGVVQGVTGGLLFWALGLPAPVLWGTVMGVLGVVPLLGAVLVWAPAAVYLGANGQWGTAAALVAWGLVMAGPVGNYLYAVTAGDRMRLHPLPTLLAYLGGLVVFGVAGMVIGPVVLAVTVGLLEERWGPAGGDATRPPV